MPVPDFGRQALKRFQQVSHRWSEVAALALTYGSNFFTAGRQHTSGFIRTLQSDKNLPENVVGGQVLWGLRIGEDEVLCRFVQCFDASLLNQRLPEGETTISASEVSNTSAARR